MDAAQVPKRLDITAYAGDDFVLTLDVYDVDPITRVRTAADFTGATAEMHIKKRPSDLIADAVLVLTSTPAAGLSFPETNQIQIEITAAQTSDPEMLAALYYDIQVMDTDGKTKTYFAGFFATKGEVTVIPPN